MVSADDVRRAWRSGRRDLVIAYARSGQISRGVWLAIRGEAGLGSFTRLFLSPLVRDVPRFEDLALGNALPPRAPPPAPPSPPPPIGRPQIGAIRVLEDAETRRQAEVEAGERQRRFFGTAPSLRLGPYAGDIVVNVGGRLRIARPGEVTQLQTENLRGMRRFQEIQFQLGIEGAHRRADERADILARARAQRAAERGEQPTPAPTAAADVVRAEIARFVSRMAFSVRLGGQHYGGLSNQELFEILKAKGPWDAMTDSLGELVSERLTDAFYAMPWSRETALRVAARAIRDRIVERFQRQGVDIQIGRNSPEYTIRKRRQGFGSRVGIRTGALLGAVKEATIQVSA